MTLACDVRCAQLYEEKEFLEGDVKKKRVKGKPNGNNGKKKGESRPTETQASRLKKLNWWEKRQAAAGWNRGQKGRAENGTKAEYLVGINAQATKVSE